MAKLIYSVISSLDGYVADENGNFDWAAPDEEVHSFVNEMERPIGTHLYGRRMYEVMRSWETAPTAGDEPAVGQEYARIWQGADKVVYSTTLATVTTARTTLERNFDRDAVGAMKAAAAADLTIGGPHLAGAALAAGLVDECHFFLTPVAVGGGTRSLPDGATFRFELIDEHRFGNGVVHLHYRTRRG